MNPLIRIAPQLVHLEYRASLKNFEAFLVLFTVDGTFCLGTANKKIVSNNEAKGMHSIK